MGKVFKNLVAFACLVSSFLNADRLTADISGLVPASLPHVSSGNYTWSTWDYLTTPYIYPLLKENAVSAIITDRIFETSEKAALAIKYNIPGLPIPVPIFFTFTLENTGDLTKAALPSADTTNPIQDTRNHTPYHQFILGSSYGNFGFGFIVQNGRAYTEGVARNQTTVFEYTRPSGPIDAQKRFDAYGFEFGYINASNPSEGYAVTIGLLYKKYGGTDVRENRDENGVYNNVYLNNLPLIEPGNNTQTGSIPTGSNRNEIQLDILGFYHITSLLNLGGSLRFFIPFASGYQAGDNSIAAPPLSQDAIEQARERNSVKLSGHYVNPVIFLDIDFPILNGEQTVGYFRLSPALNYTNLEESVGWDTYNADGTFHRKEQFYINRDTFAIDLSVKLAVGIGENKEFEIYIGWTPSLIVYEKRRTLLDFNDNKKLDEGSAGEEEREESTIIPWGTFKVREGSTGKYSAGITYRPYKSLALHLNFLKEDQFVNLARVNIGADYLF